MKKEYITPEANVFQIILEQPILSASSSVSGGDYDINPDDFDSDSD